MISSRPTHPAAMPVRTFWSSIRPTHPAATPVRAPWSSR